MLHNIALFDLINLAYLLAAICIIVGMKMLCKANTARLGLLISAKGAFIAIVAVFFNAQILDTWNIDNVLQNGFFWCFIAIFIGAIIGVLWARKVKLNEMANLLTIFNGFGGLASALIAFSSFYAIYILDGEYISDVVRDVAIAFAVFIGMLTFTASIFAWAKQSRIIATRPIVFRGQNLLNVLLLFAAFVSMAIFITPTVDENLNFIVIIALSAIAFLCGFAFILPIGRRKIPIMVSLLNSMTGVAIVMLGFIFINTMLIVTGALITTSSIVLAIVKSKSLNRSLPKLLLRGFGVGYNDLRISHSGDSRSISIENAYMILETAKTVVFVPGYGMTVAGAQQIVSELACKLERKGAIVSFCIHPNAGRLPGHINTVFAETDIPYGKWGTPEEINPIMPMQDIAIIVGANDIVNPSAETNTSSPLYGMPIIKAHEAKTVFVLKRGDGKGFSGVDNRLFRMPNTIMLYGDAKDTLIALSNEIEN
ncbi:MAG: NAD(P)(+) transhydrogenase (Re/Si-specific) subunit beta [Oscillospiraceae bacterium]|nr:NAD(P)(+) transhydrogenase (Re/Si-specific) subunit beta [Oscillospiraceae bacterium]